MKMPFPLVLTCIVFRYKGEFEDYIMSLPIKQYIIYVPLVLSASLKITYWTFLFEITLKQIGQMKQMQ